MTQCAGLGCVAMAFAVPVLAIALPIIIIALVRLIVAAVIEMARIS